MSVSVEQAAAASGVALRRRGTRAIRTLGLLSLPAPDMLVYAESERWLASAAADGRVAGAIIPPGLGAAGGLDPGAWVFVDPSPKDAFWRLHGRLAGQGFYGARPAEPAVAASARVAPTAVVGAGAELGEECQVADHAVVGPGVRLGRGVRVGPGSTLGTPGLVTYREDGRLRDATFVGTVVLEDGVRLGAGVRVDRGIWGETRIGRDCQVDNQVHVGHDCLLGRDNVLTAGVVLGGCVTLGDDNFLGLGSLVRDRVTIGGGCRIPMGGVVTASLGDGVELSTLPALELPALARLLRTARGRRQATA